jgi:hypothetical protein
LKRFYSALDEDTTSVSRAAIAIRSLGQYAKALKFYLSLEEYQRLVQILLRKSSSLYKRFDNFLGINITSNDLQAC